MIISVVSVFMNDSKAQFRKFATKESYQSLGYGTKLLKYMFVYLEENDVTEIFCNARYEKTKFYEKFGLKKTEYTFEKASKKYIIMELKK